MSRSRSWRKHWGYVYTKGSSRPKAKRRPVRIGLVFAVGAVVLFLTAATIFLKDLSTQIAVSDARDIVTVQINNAIADIMGQEEYRSSDLVDLQLSDSGEITALSSNMAKVNALSAKILHRVVGATSDRSLEVGIPIGNLTGLSLLMGRGPLVPVQIVMLTSSRVEFNNSILAAGINQTKHQIDLEVIVDIDILVPWGTESTQVVTEVLIADTIVVGQVPQTYLNLE